MTKARTDTSTPKPEKEPEPKIEHPGMMVFRVAEGISSMSTRNGTYTVGADGLIWLPNVTREDLEIIDRMLGVSIFHVV